ncbi:hypothetical protein C0J52_20441 [Blattella germanica]|nr:hypothetical protein C0J52_20441 [Blattella germanica]
MIAKTLFGLLLCYILVSVCSAGPAAAAATVNATKPAAVTVVVAKNVTAANNATKDTVLGKFIDDFVSTLEPLTPKANSLIANITKVVNSSSKVFADLKVFSKVLKGGKATQEQKDKASASVQALSKEAREVILQLTSLAKLGGTALDGLFNSTVSVLPKLNVTLVTSASASTAGSGSTAAPAKATTAAPKKG